jgi:hypothetical protein
LKNSLDSNDEDELYQSLEDKYKKRYGIKNKNKSSFIKYQIYRNKLNEKRGAKKYFNLN